MRLLTALVSVASAIYLATSVEAAPVVAGYLLLNPTNGPAKMKALADNAATIPINRIFLAFARPGMVYVPGSNTLEHVGLNYANTADFGFADLKARVATLQAAGVEVFLSCTEANMWCYTCEPKSENTVLADFDVFPEPTNSATWQTAVNYVKAGAKGDSPVFHPELVPGRPWTDPKNNQKLILPGSDYYITANRDPYQDLVYLGKDLGLAGIDIDYEEMWHADMYKNGPATGPWTNHQTVYKYAAIMRDVQINIQAIAPNLMIATAASAAGGLSTPWWGGNLKNIWYYTNLWYPDVYKFMSQGANGGGVNVMTYDLSNNQQYSECPATGVCSLSQQVNYYMKSYSDNGMTAHVGYEIGIPAYPAYDHDPTHQLPLIQSELTPILSAQGAKGGFFWELYKKPGNAANLDATSAAQQICKAALGASTPRCSGVIPNFDGTNPTTTGVPPTTTLPPGSTTVPPVTTTTPPTITTTPASCSFPAWSASAVYQSGAVVSYNGHKYTAKWWSQNNVPSAGDPWTDNGVCSSGQPTETPTPGSCNGISAYSAATAYSGGAKVTYGGFVYTASWWTQGETPGTVNVWVKGAACSAVLRRRLYY
ncbi:hypothetical protein BGZ74_008082 [Mortierella antarctica]|nr:hypothetical protein BGZ74_008082 [Mortierella antarctica]